MDLEIGIPQGEIPTNKEAEIKFASPIQVLSHVADSLEEINREAQLSEVPKGSDAEKEIKQRAIDAQNLRVLIGGIGGWGYLDGVTIGLDSFRALAAKYPDLQRLAVHSVTFLTPSLSFRHLEDGKTVASDKIVPAEDDENLDQMQRGMQRKSQDDVLREQNRLKPDQFNPAILTSAGKEVVEVRLHRISEANNTSLLKPVEVLTQIALAVEAPLEVQEKSTKVEASDVSAPHDPMQSVLDNLQGRIAA